MILDPEFDALFTGAWENPDGTAAAVLADWIIERAPSPRAVSADTLHARHQYERDDKTAVGLLWVFAPAGLPDVLGVTFNEPALGMQDTRHIPRAEFAEVFPRWLGEQLEFLYYVLSK